MHFTLNWSEFLANYWQKQPTIIRQGFTEFQDPLCADELAGLAMEEDIDSRIVARKHGQWLVEHGPFTDFSAHGETDWTLLVQAVDHWHLEAAALITPFRGLPNWRIDDLMVSYSLPGGGVGPHIDQYDVFIIQGEGKRRWRVGAKLPVKPHLPHPDLLQVEPFDAIIDVEMLPGDILYIPPGFPHDGYAIEASLNYSVGFRAPSQRELFCALADQLLAEESGCRRYGDPGLQLTTTPGAIQPQERHGLIQLMQELLEQDKDHHWLGAILSQQQHQLDLQAVEPPFEPIEVSERLQEGELLNRLGGLKAIYFADNPGDCYLAGERWSAPSQSQALLALLCNETELGYQQLEAHLQESAALLWLTDIINAGYWYFANEWGDDEE